jgi:hypothetical protein
MNGTRSIDDLKAAGLSAAKSACGGPAGLSRAMNSVISPQAISQWKQVPPERVIAVERASGISRQVLRPDLYLDLPASPLPARPSDDSLCSSVKS